jgi:hypothetical protein
VVFAPDPLKRGNPQPGLVTQLYLFGPRIDFPMTGDGALEVELFDETNGPPTLREVLKVDPVSLQKLLTKDEIGWRYTVFFPLAKYSPDMTKVRLRTAYQPPKGLALYAESLVTLGEGNGKMQITSTTLPPHWSGGTK